MGEIFLPQLDSKLFQVSLLVSSKHLNKSQAENGLFSVNYLLSMMMSNLLLSVEYDKLTIFCNSRNT